MSTGGTELLKAVKRMKAKKKGRVHTPEQLLAIAARRSISLTQKEFAFPVADDDDVDLLVSKKGRFRYHHVQT